MYFLLIIIFIFSDHYEYPKINIHIFLDLDIATLRFQRILDIYTMLDISRIVLYGMDAEMIVVILT